MTAELQPLTARQRQVYDVIAAGIAANGYPPTSREIRDRLGFASQTTVFGLVRSIARKGWLKHEANAARGLKLARSADPIFRNLKMDTLTDRQREILAFITATIDTAGRPPSLRELMARFGIASINGVVANLKAIRTKGFLDWTPGKNRSLRVLAVPGEVAS